MNQDAWKLLCELNRVRPDGLTGRIALQCAPLLVGMKPSNLLTAACGCLAEVKRRLWNTDIAVQPLYTDERQTVLFLCREEEVTAYLHRPAVAEAMSGFGYHVLWMEAVLERLRTRYGDYMRTRKTFPHELGLLLGYPVGDVLGFVKNHGEHYLYNGYWKVYGDVQKAKETFAAYAKAEEWLLRLVAARTAAGRKP